MTKLLLLLGLAVSLSWGQAWNVACSGTGTTCGGSSTFRARGYNYRTPWDSVNQCFLYYGGVSSDISIYSESLWCYADGAVTQKFFTGSSSNADCAQNGAPGNTHNPLLGHPQGYFWFQSGGLYMTLQLCQGNWMGYTTRWDATDNSRTLLSVAPATSGAGTYDAIANNFQLCDYVASYGKAICGPSSATTSFRMYEFDGSAYTNISGSVTGSMPLPMSAPGWATDGAYIWQYGGCNGTAPGNSAGTPCNGVKINDLYRYDPVAKSWTLISPVGGTKPPSTYSSYPFFAYDSRRARLLLYVGSNSLWQYSIAANQWSEITTTGGFAMTDSTPLQNGNGNTAGYDPLRDRLVLTYPHSGQSSPPAIYEIGFSVGAGTRSGGGVWSR